MEKDIRKPWGTTDPAFGSQDGKFIGCHIRTTEKALYYIAKSRKTSVPEDGKSVIRQMHKNKLYFDWWNNSLKVDKDITLINIADFIPSLDIRLALSRNPNFFTIGGEEITNLTDRQFYYNKGSCNETECWLKIEAAKKLLQAQQRFVKDGYGIIVYDAYRPYCITQKINKIFGLFLKEKGESFKHEWFGILGQEWFLAQHASTHNYGIAVDISLKDLRTGKELKMPSPIHTLDKRSAYDYWRSETSETTRNALYLREIMKSVGFMPLRSEWWHFSDPTIPKGKPINVHN